MIVKTIGINKTRSCACKLRYSLLYKWCWFFFYFSKKMGRSGNGKRNIYGDGLTCCLKDKNFTFDNVLRNNILKCAVSKTLAKWTCVGWPKGLVSFPASTCKSQKDILRQVRQTMSLANNRLMDVTQLALTWVGWQNNEKLALTCAQIRSRPKWPQVIASQCKCTQRLAK